MTEIVCAAFMHRNQVLMVRRATHRKWHPNQWDLVGGHVDKGEQADDALVRECLEEVGLRPTSYVRTATIFEPGDPKKKTPFYIYVVSGWAGKDAQLLGEEHLEIGWFDWPQIEGMDIALEGYRPVISELLAGTS